MTDNPESTHCPKHGRRWYRCCDPEENVTETEKPAQPSEVERARLDFEGWAVASEEYTPPHLCDLGENDPEPEMCIPCNTVKSARALIAAERAEAVKGILQKALDMFEREDYVKSGGILTVNGVGRYREWLAARKEAEDGR